MRRILSVTVLLGAALITWGQDEAPPVRFGISQNADAYPQNTPQAALSSVIKAVERDKADYLVAHLIEPKFIDGRIGERVRAILEDVEKEYRTERDAQRANPARALPEDRLPLDPKLFNSIVKSEAEKRAFRMITRDIRDTLADNPDHLKDFKRFLREGQLSDTGDAATIVLADLKDRQITLKKIEKRWYIEDRKQADKPMEKK